MSRTDPPRLSVLLPVIGGPEAVAKSLQCLDAQTIAGDLELLVLTSRREQFSGVAAHLPHLESLRILTGRPESSTGLCRALGVREARAPYVLNAEDHCHPEPGWAAGLLAAFDENVGAVGPDLRNGNGGNRIATADHYANFAFYKLARPGVDLPDVVGRNACYRRKALLALGEQLEPLMETEFNLHQQLRAAGWKLRFAPQAVARHSSCSANRRHRWFRSATRTMFGYRRSWIAPPARWPRWNPAYRRPITRRFASSMRLCGLSAYGRGQAAAAA